MLKHLLFIFQHRAGVRPYTSFYNLAESCVFIKQSPLSFSCHSFFNKNQAPFLPKLQGNFAEFLQYNYLIHLSLFDLSTCVGLGYGYFTIIVSNNNIALLFPEKSYDFCHNT